MEITLSDMLVAVGATLLVLGLCKLGEYFIRIPLVSGIDKRYVFITGCDSGFGNLAVRKLDKRGVSVFAACLTSRGMDDVKAQTSARVVTLLLDVTKHESIVAAYSEVQSRLPENQGLWGLVNNAGISTPRGPMEWWRREDYERVIQVNLLGVMDVTLTFLPLLKRGGGRVVNVASIQGRIAFGGSCGYSEAKYGVESFSDILRRQSQVKKYGIGVSILEPGFFITPLTVADSREQFIRDSWKRLSPEQQAEYGPQACEREVKNMKGAINYLSSPNIDEVPDAMVHALLARWPKTRYSCGTDSQFMFIPLSYAPTWFADWFLRGPMFTYVRFLKCFR